MLQYEYKHVEIPAVDWHHDMAYLELDKLGRDGWEAWHLHSVNGYMVNDVVYQKVELRRIKPAKIGAKR